MALRPVHRFLRNPYYCSDQFHRIANRHSLLNNYTLLDSHDGKQVHLVATLNSSSLLADKTRRLIEEFKPEEVYVQTSQKWWNVAKHIKTDSQRQFNSYILPRGFDEIPNHPRGLILKAKLYSWMAVSRLLFNYPSGLNLFSPSLEVAKSIHAANKVGAKVVFAGAQFDNATIQALRRDGRLNFYQPILREFFKLNSRWKSQSFELSNLMNRGEEAMAESFDISRLNWIVGYMNKVIPHQKKIIVDKRDQIIFRDLFDSKAKKIVAVVNGFHLAGVVHYWKRAHGTLQNQDVNPVGDMDINAIQEQNLVNQYLRQYYSKVCKSEPATSMNYQTAYHKDCQQPERSRHMSFNSHEDVDEHGHLKHH